ncbi:alpha/beta hydrolase [Nocardioides sambongensis]|uniref:alpha/beta hydrolase n=1 Tax=Nocardioides sambongensis TaxID=2589074 RepID=UPI00112C6FCF|nr:alpha/beta fold hydrolase [Nocardioides sambongensis]
MDAPRFYRDQQAWQDLQQFLPERLRLTDAARLPTEEHWEWEGHRVHLDRYRNPAAKARVVLHHGVGTNGRQMSLILGAPLADAGYDVVALDNLGYGLTDVADGARFGYSDWVRLVLAFLAAEDDGRPVVLYGLSAGGMLAYHVAAAAPRGSVAGIVGMTFLDQRVQHVFDATAHDIVTSRVGGPLMKLVGDTPLGAVKYPMSLAGKMHTLVNDRAAMKVLRKDRTSAANWVSIRFLADYITYVPAVEPADFAACPVLLTQPAEDRWTPYEVSRPVLDPISAVPVEVVTLDGAGHYPLEEPGLTQLFEAVTGFVEKVTATA